MLSRNQRSALAFSRPFVLKGYDHPQPAGTYTVETEEELLEGLSFAAWRRVSTTITLQSASPARLVQALFVEPAELAALHAADTR